MQAMSKMHFKAGNRMYAADLGDSKLSYGGMATPFGIRIYTTIAQAGVTDLQMLITGIIYSLVIFVCQYATGYWQTMNEITIDASVKSTIGVALYLIFLRFTPIASMHASEHQLVHALEKGIELTPESVKSQDRVHPRCGTNLMALFLVFGLLVGLIGKMPIAPWAQIGIMIPAFMLSSWSSKNIGGLLQRYFTTKTARDKDIHSAIEIGIEHNTKFIQYVWANGMPNAIKSFVMHIKNSGSAHMLISYIAVYLLLSTIFPIPGH
jgi:hypothetical protein